MNDSNLQGVREKILSDYIVQYGLTNSQLRDEIFVQIVNQTWREKRSLVAERGWLLMCACLSCFQPSSTLAKYLLKYVSDTAVEGLDVLCQHKLLNSFNYDSTRYYPPTLLEKIATRERCHMALNVTLPTGYTATGHVHSWTTAEELAEGILRQRGVSNDSSRGWTVSLLERHDSFELSGYDYVLDAIGEMEVVPYFPFTHAHWLVTTDRSKDPSSTKRDDFLNSPHNVDSARLVELNVPELKEPVPTTPRPPPHPTSYFKYTSHMQSNESLYSSQQDVISKKSLLNSYHDKSNPFLSKNSALNIRYVQRNVDANSEDILSSTSLLNKRYGKDRKNDDDDARSGAPSDMDRWVDNLFEDISQDNEDLNEASSLVKNIRGGGEQQKSTAQEINSLVSRRKIIFPIKTI